MDGRRTVVSGAANYWVAAFFRECGRHIPGDPGASFGATRPSGCVPKASAGETLLRPGFAHVHRNRRLPSVFEKPLRASTNDRANTSSCASQLPHDKYIFSVH